MASSATDLSPRAREIVAAAGELLEREGLEALSMRRLADRLGIRAPSIYKHVSGKEELEAALVSDGFEALAATFEEAVRDSADPLAELARTYRRFALARPHLYRLMTERPLSRAPAAGRGGACRAAARALPARRRPRRRLGAGRRRVRRPVAARGPWPRRRSRSRVPTPCRAMRRRARPR